MLHGFPPHDRYRVSAAVEAELGRLFAERGVPAGLAQSGQVASLDGGEFTVAPGSTAEALSAQIAAQIYRGIGR